MESRNARLNKIAPRRIRAQAAMWVTELHGPGRDAELDRIVRRWIAEDDRHAAAFELATQAWQRSGNLPAPLWTTDAAAPHSRAPDDRADRAVARLFDLRRRSRATAFAGMVVVCALTAAAIQLLRDNTLATGPREQRTVELADGSEVALNANTRILVQYDHSERRVTLSKGEALFTVVKHQARPFVVVVGDRKVIATGTSFVVRLGEPSGAAFDVTLVEGHVAIEPLARPNSAPRMPSIALKVLNPGQRLRYTGSTDKVDSPSIEKVTAWRRGQLVFDDVSMAEAAAEFNRYDAGRLSIESVSARRLRVGGVFRIGDAASFAAAMSSAYHLRVTTRGSTIVLSDPIDTTPE